MHPFLLLKYGIDLKELRQIHEAECARQNELRQNNPQNIPIQSRQPHLY